MAEDNALRRFPSHIREGNGISVSYDGNAPTISVNLQNLTVTPTDAESPVNLADALAQLLAQYGGSKNFINISDGYYDIPGSGNGYSANDGYF